MVLKAIETRLQVERVEIRIDFSLLKHKKHNTNLKILELFLIKFDSNSKAASSWFTTFVERVSNEVFPSSKNDLPKFGKILLDRTRNLLTCPPLNETFFENLQMVLWFRSLTSSNFWDCQLVRKWFYRFDSIGILRYLSLKFTPIANTIKISRVCFIDLRIVRLFSLILL